MKTYRCPTCGNKVKTIASAVSCARTQTCRATRTGRTEMKEVAA